MHARTHAHTLARAWIITLTIYRDVKSRHNFAVLSGGQALPPRAARKILAALIINGSPAERTCRSNESAFSRFGRTCGSHRTRFSPLQHCIRERARAPVATCNFSAALVISRRDSTQRDARFANFTSGRWIRLAVEFFTMRGLRRRKRLAIHMPQHPRARARPQSPNSGFHPNGRALRIQHTHAPRTRVLNLWNR